ncbi:cellulose biosynthesis protein BcsD [Kosakonia cowanii]|uniref:cellulose biosynthesis protein BcsD n=1 Tax=Kosakonia cowanii TaxID=208223 RepID=UPI0023F7D56C|nr:cellulose biosynthesis protein BcsD [Kosakonia cowanii]MDF7758277.1 cellulose biosynthesis protein BcsD [Kosakonia cowanii]
MMSSNLSPELAWHQQQQTPPGWFDLLNVIIDGMVRNVGEAQSLLFLRQMGERLAAQTPLAPSTTVGELEAAINARLAAFHWGVMDIETHDSGMTFRHRALPVARDEAQQTRWCHAFCAVLEGLYGRWMQDQGGDARLVFNREALYSVSDVLFRYANPE